MEEPSNAVIIERIANFKEEVKAELLLIKQQTFKTNGRVTRIEDEQVQAQIAAAQQKVFLWIIGTASGMIFSFIILPLLYKFFESKLF